MSEHDWIKQRDGSFFCGKHGGYFSVSCYPCTIEEDNQNLVAQLTALRDLCGKMKHCIENRAAIQAYRVGHGAKRESFLTNEERTLINLYRQFTKEE